MQPRAAQPSPHLIGCAGFSLWALVGVGVAIGLVSLAWLALVPAAVVAYLARRRPGWRDGPALLGLFSGVGLAFCLIAALNWNAWHHRSPGNEYPNPYAWGGVGVCLVIAGMVAYAVQGRRSH